MKKLMENNVVVKMDSKKVKDIVAKDGSKSGKMKELFDLGFEVKEIQKILNDGGINVIYNFVYNVVSNYININGIVVVQEKKVGKKDGIIKLYLDGKTNKEISKEMKTNYNYVLKVIKEYKQTLEQKVVAEGGTK